MFGFEAFLIGHFKRKNPIKQINNCLKCGQEQFPWYKYTSIKTLLLAQCSVAAYLYQLPTKEISNQNFNI